MLIHNNFWNNAKKALKSQRTLIELFSSAVDVGYEEIVRRSSPTKQVLSCFADIVRGQC